VSRGRLVVHGHFYQPSRVDPFSGRVPADPSAAPAHDWTARVSAECYRPNAELGNLRHISWDLGPTLADWLEAGDPVAHRGFVDGDRGVNGLAQPFHHPILPLASAADRRVEIRWGLRDFELRFGRPATGMWLPETAVDLPTLRLLAEAGVRHTILAPWQADDHHVETRRPYRVDLGDGRDIVVALYDADLSASISFEPRATADADRFSMERIEPRLSSGALPDDEPPLVVIATDAPLLPHQCERLAQRAGLGIARAGGTGGHTSGDLFIAFATGNRLPIEADEDSPTTLTYDVRAVGDRAIDALFDGAIEATEEAIVNALVAAATMVGRDGVTAHALPHERLVEIMAGYGRGPQPAG